MVPVDIKKDLYSGKIYRTYLAYVQRIGFWQVTSIDGHMKNSVEKSPEA